MRENWQRWSPLTGVLAVACMVIAFAIAGSSPSSDDSDAKITSYYTSHSHQVRQIAGLLVFLAGVLLLIAFFAVLRARLLEAEGRPGRAAALAFGAGVASAALWFVAVSLFVAPALAANDTSRFTLDPDTFRILNDTGYIFWVGATVVGALVVWATSAVAIGTGVLPRWLGWVGIPVGIILLFAVFFFPAFLYWLWILVVAIILAVRSPAPRLAELPST